MEPELLSLPECHSRLRVALGDLAPSVITLKRWSAAGKLNDAKVLDHKGRPRFKWSVVQEFARQQSSRSTSSTARSARQKDAARASAQETFGDPQAVLVIDRRDLDALSRVLSVQLNELGANLIEQVRAGITEKILADVVTQSVGNALAVLTRDIARALETVDAVRKTLMVKYDAETSALRARLEQLADENNRLKASAANIDVARLHTQLNRILDRLDDIRNRRAQPMANEPQA